MASRISPAHPRRLTRATQKDGPRGPVEASPLRQLREKLKLARPLFARLMGCSDRTLANWENGRHLPEIYQSRLHELQKLYTELSETLDSETIGLWITMPNEEFDGLKPLEVIERGETFRIWRMLFSLKSGVVW